MALPADLKTVRVTGTFVDAQGGACNGQVTFQLSNALYDRTNKVIVQPTPVVVPLVAGAIAVDLPATDDPDLFPRNNFYTVTISLAGVAANTFTMLAPYQTVGAIDLVQVAKVVISDTNPIYLQLRIDSMQDLDLTGLADGYTIAFDATAGHFKVVPGPPVAVTTVLLSWNATTGSYPPRPAGVSKVIWEGPQAPTLAQEGDVWIQTPS